MDEATRTYRFDMTVWIEPSHVAHLDPEWAADAAASALTDGYGFNAYYDEIVAIGDDERPTKNVPVHEHWMRSYRFLITLDVDPDHVAFDDPEWAADAAHGALTNEYDIEAVHHTPRLIADR
jgi:ADP-ribose pyrophosphatase YjhB (NUDIX family)